MNRKDTVDNHPKGRKPGRRLSAGLEDRSTDGDCCFNGSVIQRDPNGMRRVCVGCTTVLCWRRSARGHRPRNTGLSDGIRTRARRSYNPASYQLSYAHRLSTLKYPLLELPCRANRWSNPLVKAAPSDSCHRSRQRY